MDEDGELATQRRLNSRRGATFVVALMLLIALLIVLALALAGDSPVDYQTVLLILAGLTLSIGIPLAAPLASLARRPPVGARAPAVPLRRTMAVVAVVAAAAIAVQVVRRGVIWPWQPVVSDYPATACAALDRAGLGAPDPPDPHERTSDANEYKILPVCIRRLPDADAELGVATVDVMIIVGTHSWLSSPIAGAVQHYRFDQKGTRDVRPLAGVGDEAFTGRWGGGSRAEARVANIVIQVDSFTDGGQVAEDALRRLVPLFRT